MFSFIGSFLRKKVVVIVAIIVEAIALLFGNAGGNQQNPTEEEQKAPLAIDFGALTDRAYDEYELDWDETNFVACLLEDYVTEQGYTVDDLTGDEKISMEQAIKAGVANKRAALAEQEENEDITEEETNDDVIDEEFDVDWERYLAWNAGYNGEEYDFSKVPAEYLDEIKAAYEDGKNAYLADQEN